MNDILKHANIDKSTLTKVVQGLSFHVDHENLSSEYKLLELDNYLCEALKEGDSLAFKGDEKESAVICSKNKTYDVKEAETSNSLLLCPNLKFFKDTVNNNDLTTGAVENQCVTGIFHTYYELNECRPKLHKLRTVLEPSAFKGMEYEKTIPPETLYNWDRLRNEIQASDAELENGLRDYLIVQYKGYYRLITFEFEARAVTLILDYMDSNSWQIDEIDKESTYEALDKFIPRPVFDALFQKYMNLSEKKNKNGEQLYSCNEEKCCQLLANILLSACPVTEYTNFMEAWKLGAPENMNPQSKYLHGIAIVRWNNQKMRKEVINFPESNLPVNIQERFKELFKAKSKWTLEEITPYIKKLETPKLDVNGLLTTYARSSTINGIKYYSSKYDK